MNSSKIQRVVGLIVLSIAQRPPMLKVCLDKIVSFPSQNTLIKQHNLSFTINVIMKGASQSQYKKQATHTHISFNFNYFSLYMVFVQAVIYCYIFPSSRITWLDSDHIGHTRNLYWDLLKIYILFYPSSGIYKWFCLGLR